VEAIAAVASALRRSVAYLKRQRSVNAANPQKTVTIMSRLRVRYLPTGAWDRCYKNTGNAPCGWLPSSTPEIESGESHVSGALPLEHQTPIPMHYVTKVCANAKQGLALLSASLAVQMTAAIGQTNSGPTAHGPHMLSVFAPPPAGLTNPDSITGCGRSLQEITKKLKALVP